MVDVSVELLFHLRQFAIIIRKFRRGAGIDERDPSVVIVVLPFLPRIAQTLEKIIPPTTAGGSPALTYEILASQRSND